MSLKRPLSPSLIALTIILLAACTPAVPAQTPTPATPATPAPEVLSDCFWSATAVAFLDENENGRFDPDEPPLPDIEFILDPTVYSRTTSGPDGIANIFATTPTSGTNTSCEQLVAEHPLSISAVKFEGYQLTTPQTVAYTGSDTQYHFGFKPTQSTQSTPPEPAQGLVATATGLALSPDWPIAQVNYFFEWYGENWPVWEYEQFVEENGRYLRAGSTDFTTEIKALAAAINSLTPADSVQHTNLWTDDYPEWFIELVGLDGRTIFIYSESTGFRGHAPWYILIDDQLYRQTNGDIGFAVHDLASDFARPYFSLDEQLFDESLLEPPGRPYIYRDYHNFTGLLPIAKSFEYDYTPGQTNLTGLFYWDARDADNDSSSQRMTGIEAIQITPQGGETQPCAFEGNPDPEHPEFTLWTFTCPYADSGPQTATIHITFTTDTGSLLILDGRIFPFGFILPNGIPPS